MNKILSELKSIVWGLPTLVMLFVFGLYFTLRTKFYHPKAIAKTIRDTVGSLSLNSKSGISSFSAVATALGGTVGIGSIVGVGYGIAIGGAGSIFWMWICSFFGMGLKYAEVRIALNKRTKNAFGSFGGAHYRLSEKGFCLTAVVFCIVCVLCSFGTGNLTQIWAMTSFLTSIGLEQTLCGVLGAFLVGLAIFGGRERIAKVNTYLVPISSGIYIIICFAILILNFKNIPDVLNLIFAEAFGFDAVSGGFSGAILSRVIREGFARSLFSNEAGMGSSPIAHATGENINANTQAEWGIFEIFFDSFVVSTLTAFCLLSCGLTSASEMFFSVFGSFGNRIFGLLAAVFAFASLLSWCYYAECCILFLTEKRTATVIYRIMFVLCAFFGVYLSDGIIWDIADILNALMMFPNLFLLFICRKEIERIV